MGRRGRGSGLTAEAARQERLLREKEKVNKEREERLLKTEGCIAAKEPQARSRTGSVASVSTAASLTLSKDEEMEMRKLEAQIRRIDSLKEREASGKFLTSLEKSEIRRRFEIDYAPVMLKVRDGAARWTLDTPLSKDEEKQSAPAAVPAPAPLASACAPVSKASPAPVPACASVPEASPAPPPLAIPAPASPRHSEQDDAMSSAGMSTTSQEPTLKDMIATIRDQLEIDDSFTTPAQIIAEANRQLSMPATGSIRQQARSLLSEIA